MYSIELYQCCLLYIWSRILHICHLLHLWLQHQKVLFSGCPYHAPSCSFCCTLSNCLCVLFYVSIPCMSTRAVATVTFSNYNLWQRLHFPLLFDGFPYLSRSSQRGTCWENTGKHCWVRLYTCQYYLITWLCMLFLSFRLLNICYNSFN